MKYRLMDLLACPICKEFPLELHVFKVRRIKGRVKEVKTPECELYCGYKVDYIKNLDEFPCRDCIEHEIESGILYCRKCGRWYPIEEDIPRMLPDDLRDKTEDIKFLEKYRDSIPSNILSNGKPFNLSK